MNYVISDGKSQHLNNDQPYKYKQLCNNAKNKLIKILNSMLTRTLVKRFSKIKYGLRLRGSDANVMDSPIGD